MSLVLPPLALYVHMPWCVRKCPYCDFNSHAAPEHVPQAQYIDTPVPEPTTWALVAAGLFLLAWGRRRQKLTSA